MTLIKLVSKYLASVEHVLANIETVACPISLDSGKIEKVVSHVEAYFKDAKYYKVKERFDVSLASVAYCEGLLDALKLLGVVRFEWPERV